MKLAILTPCYRSDVEAARTWAFNLAFELRIPVDVICSRAPPWLHMARAQLLGAFWEGDANRALFRDDDVFPSLDTVRRMLESDAPAIVAPYVERDDPDYPGVRRFDVKLEADGAVRAAGLGCAMLRRSVVSALLLAHTAELGFIRNGRRYVAVFRDFIVDDEEGPKFITEDLAFWWRVRQIGYRVEALDDCLVPHAGEGLRFIKKDWVPA